MSNVTQWRHGSDADKEPIEYRECGLDDVWLFSGYEFVDTSYGEGRRIKNIKGLHNAIGEYLAGEKKALTPKELRFLRKQMDLTQSEMGRAVHLSSQQVARWEKGESQISGAAEMLLRFLYLASLHGTIDPQEILEHVEAADDTESTRIVFEEAEGEWHPQAA